MSSGHQQSKKNDLSQSSGQPGPEKKEFLETYDSSARQLLSPPGFWLKIWQHRVVVMALLAVLFLMGSVLLFWWLQQGQLSDSDRLTDYVPKQAWLYLEFNLQSEEWQAVHEQAPALALALNDFFQSKGLNQDLIDRSNKLGLAALSQGKELTWVWLLQTTAPRQLEPFLQPGSFFRQAGQEVAVIARRPGTARLFSYQADLPPLTGADLAFWSGHLRPRAATEILASDPEFYLHSQALASLLAELPEEIEFNIFLKSDQLILTSDTQIFASQRLDGILGEDIIFQNVNPGMVLDRLEQLLGQVPLADFYWREFKEEAANNYQINWHSLRQLLDQDANFLVRPLNLLSGFDFLAAQPVGLKDFQWLLILTKVPPAAEQEMLRDWFGRIAARLNPRKLTVELPDGSQMTDLIYQPADFVFVPYKGLDNSAFLIMPEQQLEFIMLPVSDGYWISNSSELVEDYLSKFEMINLTCGRSGTEAAYLPGTVLSNFSWLADFSQAVIQIGPAGLNVCLTH